MEIQRTTTVISGTLKLTYNVYTKGNKKELTGEIRKDEEIVGRFNASSSGVIGFSLSEGNALKAEEIRRISTQFFDNLITILEL